MPPVQAADDAPRANVEARQAHVDAVAQGQGAVANAVDGDPADPSEGGRSGRPPNACDPAAPAARSRAEGARPLAELSDQELLEGIREASEAHFNELYKRYFQRIYGFVHSRIRSHSDAEEIAQETFVTVFRSIDNYRGQASLLSWIFGIAKNLANNSLRKAKSQRERLDAADPQLLTPRPAFGEGTPDEELNLQRYAAAIREQMSSLADWQRRIFEMRHLQNMSIPEIAKRTHRSNDAVRSSLYRIKRMMLETAEQPGSPG